MESGTFKHLPEELAVAHLALFTDVTNGRDLKQSLVNAAKAEGTQGEEERQRLDFAFIDASKILSRQHISAAVFASLLSANLLKTPTVHSEIIYNLVPAPRSMAEGLRYFGVNAETRFLLVIKICSTSTPSDQVQAKMKELVGGTQASLDLLGEGSLVATDDSIKLHKLASETSIKNYTGAERLEKLQSIVASTAASKMAL